MYAKKMIELFNEKKRIVFVDETNYNSFSAYSSYGSEPRIIGFDYGIKFLLSVATAYYSYYGFTGEPKY